MYECIGYERILINCVSYNVSYGLIDVAELTVKKSLVLFKRYTKLFKTVTGQNIPGQNIPGQNIPGQNIPRKNIPGQNISGQNIPDNMYRTKFTGQNVSDKIYWTKYIGQNIPYQL